MELFYEGLRKIKIKPDGAWLVHPDAERLITSSAEFELSLQDHSDAPFLWLIFNAVDG